MKICQPHWDALKTAIDIRGLSHLVAKSAKDAVERLKDEVAGVETDDTFDPLMAAHTAITCRALKCGGLYLMTGDFCPLCEAEKHGGEPGLAQKWIDSCSDFMRKECAEKGLLQQPQ